MLRKNELVSEVKNLLYDAVDRDGMLCSREELANVIVERILTLIQGDNQRRS